MVPRIRWILMVMADDSPCSARVPWSGLLGDTRPLLGSRVVPVNVFQVEWRGGRLSCLARASPPGGAERGHPGRSRWRKKVHAAANWEGVLDIVMSDLSRFAPLAEQVVHVARLSHLQSRRNPFPPFLAAMFQSHSFLHLRQ